MLFKDRYFNDCFLLVPSLGSGCSRFRKKKETRLSLDIKRPVLWGWREKSVSKEGVRE